MKSIMLKTGRSVVLSILATCFAASSANADVLYNLYSDVDNPFHVYFPNKTWPANVEETFNNINTANFGNAGKFEQSTSSSDQNSSAMRMLLPVKKKRDFVFAVQKGEANGLRKNLVFNSKDEADKLCTSLIGLAKMARQDTSEGNNKIFLDSRVIDKNLKGGVKHSFVQSCNSSTLLDCLQQR